MKLTTVEEKELAFNRLDYFLAKKEKDGQRRQRKPF